MFYFPDSFSFCILSPPPPQTNPPLPPPPPLPSSMSVLHPPTSHFPAPFFLRFLFWSNGFGVLHIIEFIFTLKALVHDRAPVCVCVCPRACVRACEESPTLSHGKIAFFGLPVPFFFLGGGGGGGRFLCALCLLQSLVFLLFFGGFSGGGGGGGGGKTSFIGVGVLNQLIQFLP